jgi:Uncharacterized protein with protein kinase and helix-hairpin-helix DNA-binding domains
MTTLNMTNSQLRSLKKMTEGGEAVIYDYKAGKVMKVYKPHVSLGSKQKKVEGFIGAKLPSQIVVPRESVVVSGKFIGYTMDKVPDAEAIHQLTKNKYMKIAGFNNLDVLKSVFEIGQVLQQLHQRGVVIGDVSDNNILFRSSGQPSDIHFIDVDSWGVGSLKPDAYTEIFTAPECYGRNGLSLTKESDMFSYAVLAFNMLARIHPFNGTLEKDMNMSTTDRIKKGISVLGKEKIMVPKMVPSWRWMSPEMEEVFLGIFEKGKRENIFSVVEHQIKTSKYCPIHDTYYYGKYAECPLCSGATKLITAPMIVGTIVIGDGPKLKIIFEASDLLVLLGKTYLTKPGEVTHIATGRKMIRAKGEQVNFTDDGQFALTANKDDVTIFDKNNEVTGVVERAHGTYVQVRGSSLYYVDRGGQLIELKITSRGNMPRIVTGAYNPLFSVAESGDVFVISRYAKKALVSANGRNFELAYDDKIQEYAIKQDDVTRKWLFVYQMSNGRWRTVVFGEEIEYDSDILNYHAAPLSGICFHGGTIYDPAGGKIIGANIAKNIAKEFACAAVDESARLEFKDGGFTITTDEKIYRFA